MPGFPGLRVKTLQGLMGNYMGSGLAVITMQSIIWDQFYQAIGDGEPGGENSSYPSDWSVVYTSMILLSGISSVISSVFICCLIRMRNSCMMWLGILLNLVVGALAVIAGVFAILEMDRLYNSNEGHACYNDTEDLYKKTCDIWWWFELFVTFFSFSAALNSLGVVGVIFLGLCCGRN